MRIKFVGGREGESGLVLTLCGCLASRHGQRAEEGERSEGRADGVVTGILKGYDQLMNLVMDEVTEEYESESMLGITPAFARL